MSDDTPVAPPQNAATGDRPTPRRRRWTTVLMAASIALTVLLVGGAAATYGYYRSLRGNMAQHDLGTALEEEHRPPKIGDDVTILFIGSDGREGGNSEYGGRDFEGERSDSLMLARISPDSSVTVVSFPRDSLVQLPECAPYGKTDGTDAYYGMINAALYHGGPPCAVKTIESLTDIRVDHFVHLSFVGFREMIDAVGGVDICIPEPMHDSRSKLNVSAGQQTLDGEAALAFVRARYEVGDGGDIGRIDRQQMFLGALTDTLTERGILRRPSQLNGVLSAFSEHTATDSDLNLDVLVSLGSTLADADLDEVTFYTVPWRPAPLNPNRVVWNEEEASALFDAVTNGEPIPGGTLESGMPEQESVGEPSPAATDDGADDGGSDGDGGLQGRDATTDPCVNGLGEGTEER